MKIHDPTDNGVKLEVHGSCFIALRMSMPADCPFFPLRVTPLDWSNHGTCGRGVLDLVHCYTADGNDDPPDQRRRARSVRQEAGRHV